RCTQKQFEGPRENRACVNIYRECTGHGPAGWTRMTETSQTNATKPRLVGINHIALEVGDIDQALDFYGKIFDFTLRGKRPGNAFIELGDQFINMMQTADPHEDRLRHFGLVVDDRSSVRERVQAAGGKLLPGQFLD